MFVQPFSKADDNTEYYYYREQDYGRGKGRITVLNSQNNKDLKFLFFPLWGKEKVILNIVIVLEIKPTEWKRGIPNFWESQISPTC